ncbi:MAG: helix-turn-helix domain-containing protein [Synergistaceae bacterium]|nr:helix-turn-helix domain-containing protein [Synergistaceae bacterium]
MTIAKRIANKAPNLDAGKAPLLLKEKEVAELLGVSVSYLRKSRCEGTRKRKTPAPPFVRIDDSVYYRFVDINAWVEGLVPQQVIQERRA